MAPNQKSKLVKVGLLGGQGVGKGAINYRVCQSVIHYSTVETHEYYQFCLDYFLESYDPTDDYYRKQIEVDGELYLVECIDDYSYYQAMQNLVIKESDAILLIYSITSRPSFDSVLQRYAQILDVRRQHSLARLPVYLIANKCDEVHQQIVTPAEGLALAEHLGCRFARVSAKNAINIKQVFDDIVRDVRKTREEAKARELLVERTVLPKGRKSRLGSIVQFLRG